MSKIIKTTVVGECYKAAYHLLFDNPDAVLVHGYPICAGGEHAGQKFGHAWIEVERLGQRWAIDHSNPDKLIHERIFYHVGQIDPAECDRYTLRTAARLAHQTGIYGPWSEPPADAIFAEHSDGN